MLCLFQGLGNQENSDNVAEVSAYGKEFNRWEGTSLKLLKSGVIASFRLCHLSVSPFISSSPLFLLLSARLSCGFV